MKTIATFNALHLGDNLVHLHFLRKLAQAYPEINFTHGAPDQHLAQLAPLVGDLPNLTLTSIAHTGQGALNAWCGADGWWYQQGDTSDWLAVYTRWLDVLAGRMGLANPIRTRTDFLFDYPALRAPVADGGIPPILLINSAPLSGQWRGFSHDGFDRLIVRLRAAGHTVITTSPSLLGDVACTQDVSMDVTAIGRLSQRCQAIIGCVTGPMWPCFNIWNADTVKHRIHLLDAERVDCFPATTVHCTDLSLVPEILRDRGLL